MSILLYMLKFLALTVAVVVLTWLLLNIAVAIGKRQSNIFLERNMQFREWGLFESREIFTKGLKVRDSLKVYCIDLYIHVSIERMSEKLMGRLYRRFVWTEWSL